MRKLLLLIIFLILNSCLFAQTWAWGSEGSSMSDTYAVAADAKGNGYLAGGFSTTITFGKVTLSSAYPDSYLVKYDSSGNVIWGAQTKSANSTSNAKIVFITTDIYGNIYATGYFSGNVAFGAYTLLTPLLVPDVFLVKYNSAGKVLWAVQSNSSSPNEGYGNSLATDNAGNVYVTGYFKKAISFGNDTLTTPYSAINMFTVKYDSAGKVLWASSGVSPQSSYGASLSADNAGDVYVTGAFTDSIVFGAYMLNSIAEDMFLIKYDTAGKLVWVTKAFQASSKDHAWGISVVTDGAGAIYTVGQYFYSIAFGTNKITSPLKSSIAIFLAKFSSAGNSLWLKNIDTANGLSAYCLAVDSMEHIYYSGSITATSSSEGPDPSIIIKFDSAGKPMCYSSIGTGGDDNNGIAVSPNGICVYLGGDIYDSVIFGKDTLHYKGGEPPFIARWLPCNPNPQGISEVMPFNEKITVYPNPSNGLFTIQSSVVSHQLSVEVYNVLGEKVYNGTIQLQGDNEIDLRNEPSGIYFVRVYDQDQKFIATTKIIIE